MKLKGTPLKVINRFWKKYEADKNWYLEAKTKEELEIFVAYWFELEEEKKDKIIKKNLKSKK
jgi:hypothetical protein